MSNTPNPRRRVAPLERVQATPAIYRSGSRVWTALGSMLRDDYDLLQRARPDVLPAFDALPVKPRLLRLRPRRGRRPA